MTDKRYIFQTNNSPVEWGLSLVLEVGGSIDTGNVLIDGSPASITWRTPVTESAPNAFVYESGCV